MKRSQTESVGYKAMKRTLGLLLLAVWLLPCMTLAQTITVRTGTELRDAVDAMTEGTIRLACDVEDGVGVFVDAYAGKNLTIDFAGHRYAVNHIGWLVGPEGEKNSVFHVERGNTIALKNGTIRSVPAKTMVYSECDLTLSDVTLDGSGMGSGRCALQAVCGDVELSGKTNLIAPENGAALAVVLHEDYPMGVRVSVNTTGEVKGDIRMDLTQADDNHRRRSKLDIQSIDHDGAFVFEGDDTDGANVTVSGGRFREIPACAAVRGTWVEMSTAENDFAYVGTPERVGRLAAKDATPDSEIIVRQGDAKLNRLPAGAVVYNDGRGKVTVDGVLVPADGEGYTVPQRADVRALPDTGDTSAMFLWAALLTLGCTGMMALRKARRA